MIVTTKRKWGEKVQRRKQKVAGIEARDRRLDTAISRVFEDDTPNNESKQQNM